MVVGVFGEMVGLLLLLGSWPLLVLVGGFASVRVGLCWLALACVCMRLLACVYLFARSCARVGLAIFISCTRGGYEKRGL